MTVLLSPVRSSAPRWLLVVSALGVVWYGFGLLQFTLAVTLDRAAAVAEGAMTPTYAEAMARVPGLIWAAYALACIAGLAGAALLLVGRGGARVALAVSLASAAVYYLWLFALGGVASALGAADFAIGATVLAVTTAFLILALRRRA